MICVRFLLQTTHVTAGCSATILLRVSIFGVHILPLREVHNIHLSMLLWFITVSKKPYNLEICRESATTTTAATTGFTIFLFKLLLILLVLLEMLMIIPLIWPTVACRLLWQHQLHKNLVQTSSPKAGLISEQTKNDAVSEWVGFNVPPDTV